MSDCVDDGLLLTNPAISKGGRRKRHGAMTKKDRTERIRPMSWSQRERFLAAAYEFDGLHGTLFETMVKTGIRPGEALSLRIDDLDFHSWKRTPDRTYPYFDGVVGMRLRNQR